jgi:hypothetical protein
MKLRFLPSTPEMRNLMKNHFIHLFLFGMPSDICKSIISDMEKLLHVDLLNDALHCGWDFEGPMFGGYQILCPPAHFECSNWCSNFNAVHYNNQVILVTSAVLDFHVRETGTWK